jgi:hypothetical protein
LPATDPWPGCHGVRLRPHWLATDYGAAVGIPLADAELVRGPVGPSGVAELWRIEELLDLPGGARPVDQILQRRADGAYVLVASGTPTLSVDPARNRITVEHDDEGVVAQLVATLAVPLVLEGGPALVLHASTCAFGGEAVLVCATSGSGKSSLLVGLLEAGWQAVSEDMCAVDVRPQAPAVWPGPPWVRRAHDDPGPPGAARRFRTPDKNAWDVSPWQVDEPLPIGRIVFLERAGGDEVVYEPLSATDALMQIARHAVWLREPEDRAAGTFPGCATLVRRVPAMRLRLPVSSSWLERAAALLGNG